MSDQVQSTSFFYNVPQKYMKLKEQGDFVVAKYSKKAFFDQAWNTYPELLQARGTVFIDDRVVARPLDKIFNYSENGAGLSIPAERVLIASTKVNGFFGALTRVGDRIIIQTTGTAAWLTDAKNHKNDFIRMFRSFLDDKQYLKEGLTYMVEVVHPENPHIVNEDIGIHPFAVRDVRTGVVFFDLKEFNGDIQSNALNKNVQYYPMTKNRILDLGRTTRGEGYVVYDRDFYNTPRAVFKLKSPHYLRTKFLARIGTERLQKIDNQLKTESDEELRAMIRCVIKNREWFASATEQERISFLDGISSSDMIYD